MEAVALVALLLVVVVKAFAIHRLNVLEGAIRTVQAEEAEVSRRLHDTESVYRQLEQDAKGLEQETKHLENDKDLASLEITKFGGTPITLEQLEAQVAPQPEPPAQSASSKDSEPTQPPPDGAASDAPTPPAADGDDASIDQGPKGSATQTAPSPPAPPTGEPGSPRQRILVVDDNNELRGLLHQALSMTYDVVEAPDGFDALNKILKEKQIYDLIITDLKMPKLNGITLVEHLPDKTPVIIISGFCDTPEFKASLSNLPAAIVLKKPFKVSMLRSAIQKALSPEPTS